MHDHTLRDHTCHVTALAPGAVGWVLGGTNPTLESLPAWGLPRAREKPPGTLFIAGVPLVLQVTSAIF